MIAFLLYIRMEPIRAHSGFFLHAGKYPYHCYRPSLHIGKSVVTAPIRGEFTEDFTRFLQAVAPINFELTEFENYRL